MSNTIDQIAVKRYKDMVSGRRFAVAKELFVAAMTKRAGIVTPSSEVEKIAASCLDAADIFVSVADSVK